MRLLRFAAAAVLLASAPAHAQPAPPAPASVSGPSAVDASRIVGSSPLGACVRRPPEYPKEALRAEAEGTTYVMFVVDDAGHAGQPSLRRPAGSHASLDTAAMEHLGRCLRRHADDPPLPPGPYILPITWRLE